MEGTSRVPSVALAVADHTDGQNHAHRDSFEENEHFTKAQDPGIQNKMIGQHWVDSKPSIMLARDDMIDL